MAKYTVKKLDFSRADVRQRSFQILYAAFHFDTDRKTAQRYFPKSESAFRKLGQIECYGVFRGAGQVGFGILTDLKEGAYRLSYISVDPAFQHDRAGRTLILSILRDVVSRGGKTVIVQINVGDKLQRKWFQSMGFSSLRRGTDDGATLVLTVNDTIRSYLNLCDSLDRYANLIYGFYSVDEEPYCETYPSALVLMQPFRCLPQESDREYHEKLIHEKSRMNAVLRSVSNYLTDRGISNLPMPLHRDDVDETLPRKAAALRAGLGWLGKNDRVVHRLYGSQTVTARIYLGEEFPVNTHIRRNECGDCRRCVDACPVGCLKNKKWSPRIPRREVIDEALCLEYRSRAYAQTGRYEECDLCLRCCPGKKE